jgi:L-iditol 2-dehydrogenase
MKAIVQTGERAIEVQDRQRPSPGPEEVLVEVHAAGLCGSDAHAYTYEGGYEWVQMPRIMGHEYAGVVSAVGDAVERFAPGDHVVEEPIHDCGECFQCRNGQPNVCQDFAITGMHSDGAYAEYTVVNGEHLHRVPESIPLAHAAITEPVSIAARAVFEQSTTTPGDTVLVEGPGPIGALTAVIADAMGATVLVSGLERDTRHRLPVLDSLGIATATVEDEALATRAETMTDGLGFDHVFDTTGHHSGVEQAAAHVRKGGEIVVVGLPGEPSELDMTPLVRGEVACRTSYGSTWRNFEQAIRCMENGTIEAGTIVETTYDIADPTAAFEDFLAGETCKPVFEFAAT